MGHNGPLNPSGGRHSGSLVTPTLCVSSLWPPACRGCCHLCRTGHGLREGPRFWGARSSGPTGHGQLRSLLSPIAGRGEEAGLSCTNPEVQTSGALHSKLTQRLCVNLPKAVSSMVGLSLSIAPLHQDLSSGWCHQPWASQEAGFKAGSELLGGFWRPGLVKLLNELLHASTVVFLLLASLGSTEETSPGQGEPKHGRSSQQLGQREHQLSLQQDFCLLILKKEGGFLPVTVG